MGNWLAVKNRSMTEFELENREATEYFLYKICGIPLNLFYYLYRCSITLLANLKVWLPNHPIFWASPCYIESANSRPRAIPSFSVLSVTNAQRSGLILRVIFSLIFAYSYESHLLSKRERVVWTLICN